jgi:hypothetical protein
MGSGSFLKVLLSNIDVLAGYGLLSLSLSLFSPYSVQLPADSRGM